MATLTNPVLVFSAESDWRATIESDTAGETLYISARDTAAYTPADAELIKNDPAAYFSDSLTSVVGVNTFNGTGATVGIEQHLGFVQSLEAGPNMIANPETLNSTTSWRLESVSGSAARTDQAGYTDLHVEGIADKLYNIIDITAAGGFVSGSTYEFSVEARCPSGAKWFALGLHNGAHFMQSDQLAGTDWTVCTDTAVSNATANGQAQVYASSSTVFPADFEFRNVSVRELF